MDANRFIEHQLRGIVIKTINEETEVIAIYQSLITPEISFADCNSDAEEVQPQLRNKRSKAKDTV